jgi:hypothetical protein
MLFLVYGKETVKETWEALKIMHMGAECEKEAKVQTLKTEFKSLHEGVELRLPVDNHRQPDPSTW